MRADLRKVQEQFSNSFYKIPKFQRGYAWRDKQWADFWRAIAERALEIDTTNSKQSPVFMGAIVLQEQPPEIINASEFKVFDIIDGQQRFVTISVFLATVRDFYFGVGGTHYATWTKAFLTVSLNLFNTNSKIRLTLQDEDNDVYEIIIGDKDSEQWRELLSGSHPLEKLYTYFWKSLSKGTERILEELIEEEVVEDVFDSSADEEQEGSEESRILGWNQERTVRDWRADDCFNPETITAIIVEHMRFAVIEIEENDNEIAFEVFEVLNAQGQPLAEVDKFRNGFFMLDPENSDSNYHAYWKPMEERVRDNELLSTFFNEETIRRLGLTPKDKTYQRLMTYIKDKSTAAAVRLNKAEKRKVIESEFKDLNVALKAFMIVNKGLDPLQGQSDEGNTYGLHLNMLKNIISGPATPLLMDVIKWSENSRTDREIQIAVNNILKSVESLLIRRLVGGVKPQQLRSLLAELPRKITADLKVIDPNLRCTVENLNHYHRILNNRMIRWQPERFPTDALLLSNPLRDVYKSTGRKLSLFSVLWDLERSKNSEFMAQKIPTQIGKGEGSWSIEHVLPQGTKQGNDDAYVMNSEWKANWETWGVEQPEVDFTKCVHSIGNLTIVVNRTNSQLGNKVFSRKKEIYDSGTRIILTDDIKSEEIWTPLEIEKRSIKLINMITSRWPYPTLQE
jgi:uncharacterized protein with ParB-like and HNH nuclease domain